MLSLLWPGDWLLRRLIRYLNRRRLAELEAGGVEAQWQRKARLIEQLEASPLALSPERANQQHYEVPSRFFEAVLGPSLKYSCGWWEGGDLARAEQAMLDLYVERAQLKDRQRVLELGCGWGSLTLYLARRFPRMHLTAVSNSHSQRQFILQRAPANLEVLTCDINELTLPAGEFDRVVSIEMFEHMRNYRKLMQLVHDALKPGGKLFVHVFAHRQHAYTFDIRGRWDWMEREFFSGGTMPSPDLLLYFQGALRPEEQWAVAGAHYARTAEAWLARLRENRATIQPLLKATYGRAWRHYWTAWQLFFLACAETFAHGGGQEWLVHHQRWVK